MCNYFDNKIAPKKLEEVYNRTYDLEEQDIKTSEFVNGFAHDKMPIIADEVSEEFVIGSWGISAPWIKEDDKKALLPLNARLDEFYTQLPDIENELKYYKKHFKGKVVLCNCDDPRISNFFHYFSYNFEKLGLKKLITTCYKNQDADLFSQLYVFKRKCTRFSGVFWFFKYSRKKQYLV